MHNTTDIKALRERLISADSVEELHSFAIYLIDQLEAERQRADNASFRENHLNEMLNEKIQQNAELRLEIAALKGDQVPVAYHVYVPDNNIGIYYSSAEKDSVDAVLAEYGHLVEITPLFTAPQKPVVLPPLPAAIGDFTEAAMKAVRRMDIAAIEAAGGKVEE